MVSHSVGTRFIQLIGGVMTSFYDWYADLPVASPQVFGDQTDVPESGDWWDATYLMMWGSNVPVTRTPDAHWMAEARYRGTKVVAVSPDYADNTKFADEWLPAQAGTDAALAMAMGHVILKEFFVDRQRAVLHRLRAAATPTCRSWSGSTRRATARSCPGKFLTAADLRRRGAEDAAWKTVLLDGATGEPARAQRLARVPVHRVRHGQVEPRPRRRRPRAHARAGAGGERRRDAAAARSTPGRARRGDAPRRAGSPGRRPPGDTVFDLMLAQYGVAPRRAARASGRPATTTRDAVHPGLAGGDHRRAGRGTCIADRPRVRAQRRGVRRPVDDHHGRRASASGSTATRRTGRSWRC